MDINKPFNISPPTKALGPLASAFLAEKAQEAGTALQRWLKLFEADSSKKDEVSYLCGLIDQKELSHDMRAVLHQEAFMAELIPFNLGQEALAKPSEETIAQILKNAAALLSKLKKTFTKALLSGNKAFDPKLFDKVIASIAQSDSSFTLPEYLLKVNKQYALIKAQQEEKPREIDPPVGQEPKNPKPKPTPKSPENIIVPFTIKSPIMGTLNLIELSNKSLFTSNVNTSPLGSLLQIRKSSTSYDPMAISALHKVVDAGKYKDNFDKLKQLLKDKPTMTTPIREVSQALSKGVSSEMELLLLSNETLYGAVLFEALKENKNAIDMSSVRYYESQIRFMLNNGENAPAQQLKSKIIDLALLGNGIQLNEGGIREMLDKQAQYVNFPLAKGLLAPAVISFYNNVRAVGNVPALVSEYLTENGVFNQVTDAFKQSMVKYLLDLNIPKVKNGGLSLEQDEEYFVLAYDYAMRSAQGGTDPVDNMRNPGMTTDWDFQVETFDSYETQGIIPDNIKAAGALDYVFELGDHMGIYKIVDALILNWAAGGIDVPQGPTASKLYRYFKLRDERASADERGMLYKRVLDKGEAKLLNRMMPNKEFSSLWNKLMREVTLYIQKSEDVSGVEDRISKTAIYKATEDLQYNLSTVMTGMAHLQVTEMYAHLKECFDILSAEEIVSQYAAGARRNMWTVIERIAREEFKQSINVFALRTAAVEGNKIFNWIASFNAATVTTEQTAAFLSAAESYILALGQLSDNEDYEEDEEGYDNEAEENVEDDF